MWGATVLVAQGEIDHVDEARNLGWVATVLVGFVQQDTGEHGRPGLCQCPDGGAVPGREAIGRKIVERHVRDCDDSGELPARDPATSGKGTSRPSSAAAVMPRESASPPTLAPVIGRRELPPNYTRVELEVGCPLRPPFQLASSQRVGAVRDSCASPGPLPFRRTTTLVGLSTPGPTLRPRCVPVCAGSRSEAASRDSSSCFRRQASR